jgi:catechol 2,3-dioxygenase-like lactoylglutathione lyase family enzyme
MIDHVTIPVAELGRSKRFYEEAFASLGFKWSFGEEPYFHAFDIGRGLFEIAQNNGTAPITSFHVAFRAQSREHVQAFYLAALKAGAKDNGAPGPRPQYTENYYACFVLDPDGHNIEAMFDVWNGRSK